MMRFYCDVEVGRCQEKRFATGASKRPDFLLWMNDALVMKGEETGKIGRLFGSVQELKANMEKIQLSVFGEMPFLFAYAASNSWVQFWVIDRSLGIRPISSKLELNDLDGRIRCVFSSINICRILYHYPFLLARTVLPMYREMPRNNGSITLYEDYVLKKLEYDPNDFDAVIAIYDAIRKNQIESAIICEYDRSKRTFKLQPVGFKRIPAVIRSWLQL